MMNVTLHIDPTLGMQYPDILRLGHAAKSAGLSGLLRSDHYQLQEGLAVPTTDAWTTLAGLVRELDVDLVGTLVSPIGFRHPSVLAKQVATVASMSRGPRLELGIGMGNHEWEHRSFGFGFPSARERFAALREYLSIVRSLLREEEVSIDGQYYQLDRCRCLPGSPDTRIILGSTGTGEGMLRLATEMADELNIGMLDPSATAARVAAGRVVLAENGRGVESFTFSWGAMYLLGRDRQDLHDRAERLRNTSAAGVLGLSEAAGPEDLLERLRSFSLVGTPREALEQFRALREAGIQRFILGDVLGEEEHIALLGEVAHSA